MTASESLMLFGLAIQATGAFVTAVGFWNSWQEFADERLIGDAGPIIAAKTAATRTTSTADAFLRRITRRPRNVEAHLGSVHITGGGSITLDATISPAPLDPTLDTAAALAILDERTRELSTRISGEASKRARADDEVRAEVRKVDERVDDVRADLGSQGRHIAVGGIRIALLGIGMIVLGIMLQGIGLIVG